MLAGTGRQGLLVLKGAPLVVDERNLTTFSRPNGRNACPTWQDLARDHRHGFADSQWLFATFWGSSLAGHDHVGFAVHARLGCVEKPVGQKANGAGIAADPTLTRAWPSEEGLGGRCSASCSHHIRRCGRSLALSPVLAPASGSFQFQLRSEDLCLPLSVPRPFNP